ASRRRDGAQGAVLKRSSTRSARAALLVLAGLLAGAAGARAETPVPAAPTSWVTDRAGFLGQATVDELDRKLDAYARQTGHQVLVYIDHTTGGVPIEDWAVKAFERWRVGRKGIDDGVALFVFSDDHRVRIEVGYGLEPVMPDTRASRIIREAIVPRIQAGDRDGAVRAGVDAIVTTLGGAGQPGQTGQPAVDETPAQKISFGRMLVGLVGLGLVLVLLLGFAVTHPGLAWLLTTMIGSGRGRGGGGGWGGGGGGGGFSGGGARSGGGGASGSW
ncbi:MAG TPA: TPM domain-containing protein, partial [Polyangia bacterium]|nr:TPM domain-containing protein [Polyangia bacterium]